MKLFSAPTPTDNNFECHSATEHLQVSQERVQNVHRHNSRNSKISNRTKQSSMSFQDLGLRRGAGNQEQMQELPKMLSKMVIHRPKPRSPPLMITTTRHSSAAASMNTRSFQPSSATSKVRPPKNPTMSASLQPPAPAITTRCPVTSRSLLDDLGSFGDSQIPNQSSSCDVSEAPTAYDEDPMLPIVAPRENRPSSIFAKLTTEIANYQRMVSELESLLVSSSSNPEAQWRSRILIRSAKDADLDIWRRLYVYEANFGDGSNFSRAHVASRKLHRDFKRVHKHLMQFMGAYHLRQQAEVSMLSTSANAGEEKEEFFDRAMRERHAEVNQIHSSMHKVNDIYTVSLIYADIFYSYKNLTIVSDSLVVNTGRIWRH
jgi:hypothetical protein